MKPSWPIPYFADAPVATIVAAVVTAAVAIDGISALAAAALPRPVQWLGALIVFVIGLAAVIYEIAGPAPVLIPARRRLFRRRP